MGDVATMPEKTNAIVTNFAILSFGIGYLLLAARLPGWRCEPIPSLYMRSRAAGTPNCSNTQRLGSELIIQASPKHNAPSNTRNSRIANVRVSHPRANAHANAVARTHKEYWQKKQRHKEQHKLTSTQNVHMNELYVRPTNWHAATMSLAT